MENENNLTIEQSFEKLEEMAALLENGNLSLEDSFKIYEKAMNMLKDVSGRIDDVEKKIKIIDENGVLGDL
ncbi:MAG: exodeoxyribonuclease VII small subunit [Lachnospiraceae bacterium]|jgi:exodeoxyribonuclease VII small subunit